MREIHANTPIPSPVTVFHLKTNCESNETTVQPSVLAEKCGVKDEKQRLAFPIDWFKADFLEHLRQYAHGHRTHLAKRLECARLTAAFPEYA